jgi:hypothetical protein
MILFEIFMLKPPKFLILVQGIGRVCPKKPQYGAVRGYIVG